MRFSGPFLTLVVAFFSAFAPVSAAAPGRGTLIASEVTTPRLSGPDVTAWLDAYLPGPMATGEIAGAVVVVVKNGRILSARGYGYADVERRKPVDPRTTLFRPGSASKTFTWTAVMQLVEAGKISLDADINDYLDFRIPAYRGRPITMRNLMQHSAGFENQGKWIMSYDPKRVPSFEQLVKGFVPKRIFAPGSTPAYSNYGTSLAGYIVERVSGKPFGTYIYDHIFRPLGMSSSTFEQPLPGRLKPFLSQGYQLASGPPRPFEIIGPAPAGGLSATGLDMAKFMIAHLQGGDYRGKAILQPGTIEIMHNSPLAILPRLNRMQLGFFETNVNGHQVIAHFGDTQFFHTAVRLFVDDKIGLYISMNSTGKNGAAGNLRERLFRDFADRYLPDVRPKPAGRIPDATARRHAKLMAGNWISSRRSESNFFKAAQLLRTVELTVSPDGRLMTPSSLALDGRTRTWVEIAPFLWYDFSSKEHLAATTMRSRPVRFSVDGYAPYTVFDRPIWYDDPRWILPALYGAIAILILGVAAWPARMMAGRFGWSRSDPGTPTLSYAISAMVAASILAVLAGWAVTLSRMLAQTSNLTDKYDAQLWFLQIAGAIIFLCSPILILLNGRPVWRSARDWIARTIVLLLFAASCFILFFAGRFHLVDIGVRF